MKYFTVWLSTLIAFIITQPFAFSQRTTLAADAEKAMLNATKFMVEEVSTQGGYASIYLPDFSRRWGELESYKTQVWVQDPGTVSMGNLLLDAYHATGDEYYYEAAEKAAEALIWGQLPCGGWNYIIDFAGDRSLKEWYNTIGKNAWGFEEYYHYYGNATFDDVNTSEAAKFLLRIYLRKLDPKFKPALDNAIAFILESQYPLGGWPQRYPLKDNYPHGELADYTSFYTFNDDVIWGNIAFLIDCYVTLGQERLLDPIHRGMNFYLITQQGNPQAGWGQQYDMDLKPAHARTYEPPALLPGRTYTNAMLLLRFYEFTGDRRFLSRVPDAIQWLEDSRLPASQTEGGKYTHPTFVEIGTNKPIYAHRKGTGVKDGHYWWDYNDENQLAHYGGKGNVNVERLKQEYQRVNALTPEEATENSPLIVGEHKQDFSPQELYEIRSQINLEVRDESEVKAIINALDERHRWLVTNVQISRPYAVSETGEETNTAKLSDENGRGIRDTSGQQYISTREYENNMRKLISFIQQQKP
ncbi:MAG TPA: pectate lyase [Cyclobacteriaceae bacterium]|nr:pectate lyase [Cyclobacteriaceae bacterium]